MLLNPPQKPKGVDSDCLDYFHTQAVEDFWLYQLSHNLIVLHRFGCRFPCRMRSEHSPARIFEGALGLRQGHLQHHLSCGANVKGPHRAAPKVFLKSGQDSLGKTRLASNGYAVLKRKAQALIDDLAVDAKQYMWTMEAKDPISPLQGKKLWGNCPMNKTMLKTNGNTHMFTNILEGSIPPKKMPTNQLPWKRLGGGLVFRYTGLPHKKISQPSGWANCNRQARSCVEGQ